MCIHKYNYTQELGIQQSVMDLTQAIDEGVPLTPTRSRHPTGLPKAITRKRKQYFVDVPVRRSGRLQGGEPESLDEDEMFRKIGIDRLDLLAPTRRRCIPMDPSAIASIRQKRIKELEGDEAAVDAASSGRGTVDSGLGVRIQGGRVYDSKFGVTCHWCRQKTLEMHVECTAAGCGGGNRLPISFCRMCLRNRHGENVEQAIASGCWVCPVCRGGCGEGCKGCCNCGPCRKKAGLGPTHQLIKQARSAGFDNVHDFLVHRSTGQSPEVIAARKLAHPWGRFALIQQKQKPETAAVEVSCSDEETAMVDEDERTGTLMAGARVVRNGAGAGEVAKSGDKLTRKQRIFRKMGLGRLAAAT